MQRLKQFLKQPATLTALSLFIYDYIVLSLFESLHTVTPLATLICVLFSFSFWFFIQSLFNFIPFRFKKIIALVLAITIYLSLVGNFITFMKFGEYITGYMLLFTSNIDGFMWTSFKNTLNPLVIIIGIFVISAYFLIWQYDTNARRNNIDSHFSPKSISKKSFSSLMLLIVTMILFNQVDHETANQHKFVDASLVLAYKNFAQSDQKGILRASLHAEVKSIKNPQKTQSDIIIYIGESFGKQNLSFYGYNQETTPNISNYLNKYKNQTAIFQHALTNSSATDVSLPSFLTGVGPEESQEKLHSMPFLWQWAKSAGYYTVFATAQRARFAQFSYFITSPGPDLILTADKMDGEIINDEGMDELKSVERVVEKLKQKNIQQPLLIIYFTAATHYPFQEKSELAKNIPTNFSRYEKALWITDLGFSKLINFVEDRNPDSNYFLFLTADHGELPNQPRGLPRVASFYDEIVGIPMFVKFPIQSKNALVDKCFNQMIEQQNLTVQNKDILPTLVDLWAYFQHHENQPLYHQLKGSSLCQKIDPHRAIIGINTNDIRHWNPEGFYIARGDFRYVYSNKELGQLFNVTTDPLQKNPLNLDAYPDLKTQIQQDIQNNLHLKRIYDLYQKTK